MNITALQRPVSLVEGVCQQLADLIRGTHCEDERWLPAERSLAEQLGVSRTVVREATKRLEQQGLLEIQHGTGIKVVNKLHRPLNDSLALTIPNVADRLQQLNEARLSIEPSAAALAAERATPLQIEQMQHVQNKLEAAPDHAAAIQADLEWHGLIVEASGNQIFGLILDSLGDLSFASRLRTIGRIGKESAVLHHAQIFTAIRQRNPVAAADAMRIHIIAAGKDMELDAIASQNS
jgi:GntR family transcriptional regulator, transcriptional repressor for pyruvate dehydrogenase complex